MDLGVSIPNDPHAISVSLPSIKDVVGYEEGEPRVISSMQSGYPRFRFHNYISELTEKLSLQYKLHQLKSDSAEISCIVLPALSTALRLVAFLAFDSILVNHQTTIRCLHSVPVVKVVFFHSSFKKKVKLFWQHCGETISSRLSQYILNELYSTNLEMSIFAKIEDNILVLSETESSTSMNENNQMMKDVSKYDTVINNIKSRIINIIEYHSELKTLQSNDICLTVTGMAAIFTSFRISQKYFYQRMGNPCIEPDFVVFGFPYLDTLKIMSRPEWNKGKIHFFGSGDESELDQLVQILEAGQLTGLNGTPLNQVAAVYTEFPSNPLLKCCNLSRLSDLATQYGFVLVVDDTIANFANVNLFHGDTSGVKVNILCSSLSKIFSGMGNVMAGSLILNPYQPDGTKFQELKAILTELIEMDDIPKLFVDDAVVLDDNSKQFLRRSHEINQNALQLCEWFRKQTKYIANIFYPGLDSTLGKDKEADSMATGKPSNMYTSLLRPPIVYTNANDQSCIHTSGYGCLMSIVFHPHVDSTAFYDALPFLKGPSLGTEFTLVCPYTLLAHYDELDWAAKYGVDSKLIRISVGMEPIQSIIEGFHSALIKSLIE